MNHVQVHDFSNIKVISNAVVSSRLMQVTGQNPAAKKSTIPIKSSEERIDKFFLTSNRTFCLNRHLTQASKSNSGVHPSIQLSNLDFVHLVQCDFLSTLQKRSLITSYHISGRAHSNIGLICSIKLRLSLISISNTHTQHTKCHKPTRLPHNIVSNIKRLAMQKRN